MKKTTTKIWQPFTMLLLLTLAVNISLGQTPIFTESMGTVASTTTLAVHEAANGFDNDGYTMTQGGATNPCDIRVTSPSSTYPGASGGANVWFVSTNGQYGFAIEGIDASAYYNLSLSYGYRKEAAASHATFSVDYWDGAVWVNIANTSGALFNEAPTATAGWYAAKTLPLPAGAQINGLKIRFSKTGTFALRLDDVKLSGTPKLPQTISFGPLTNKTYGDASFVVSATGGASGNPVVFTSSDPAIATCTGTNGETIIVKGGGTCMIYADQAGNGTYLAANQAGQPLTINKAMLTVTADAKNKIYGSLNPPLTFVYTGFLGTDDATVLNNQPIAGTPASQFSPVTTYPINVSGGFDGNYDFTYVANILTINEPITQIIATQCGASFTDLFGYFYCDTIIGAQDYEWEFVNSGLAYSFTRARGSDADSIQKNWILGLRFGETYNVRVRTKVNGIWFSFGSTCAITISGAIPTPQLDPGQCGLSVTDLTGTFNCNFIAGADDYEWEFSNTGLAYSYTRARGTALASMPRAWIIGLRFGETYDVRVRCKIGGIWGSFGPTCTITISGAIPSTQVDPGQCGLTVPDLSGNFSCNAIAGAQDYEWEFVNSGLGYSYTRARGTGLSTIPRVWILGLQYGATYNVKVRTKVGGVWGTFGSACTISIAVPFTQVASGQCGASVYDLFGYFNCNALAGAQDYEWEFVNSGLGYTFTKTRGSNSASIQRNWILGLRFGETYTVRVRAKVNGTWGNFGFPCSVTIAGSIPTTQVDPSQCGLSVPDFSGNFNCNFVAGAEDYEWEFMNSGLLYSFTRARGAGLATIPKVWIQGLQYGATYNVKVRVKVGGLWGNFGTACPITIAGSIPTTQVVSAQCNLETNLIGNFSCNSVSGAEDYEWEFFNSGLLYSFTRSRGAGFTTMPKAWITGLLNGYTYNVKVRAKVGGVWGTFSNICQITINTALLLENNNNSDFREYSEAPVSNNLTNINSNIKLAVFPNPSGNNGFNISMEGIVDEMNEISITVYDMTGRKVYEKTINHSEGNQLEKINEDGKFNRGIYLVNVLVNGQASQQKVIIE